MQSNSLKQVMEKIKSGAYTSVVKESRRTEKTKKKESI
ncbi:hypothetical protein AsAng_0038130 [Aureispira anguillae]|nr:hypothetical protein AsAng_0038130 [Aureispira anguillae]